MLTSTPSRSHGSPGRTGFVTLLVLAVLATAAGLGFALTRHREHPPVAATGTTTVAAPPTTTAPPSVAPSQRPPGQVPFLALPVGTPPSPGASEAGYPWHQLRAVLHGPTRLPAGESATYTVVMSNPTAQPISLQPCPAYDLTVGLRDSSYGLNCAGAPSSTISPGASMTFEVAVYVPRSIGSGTRTTVTWTLGWQTDPHSPHASIGLDVQ